MSNLERVALVRHLHYIESIEVIGINVKLMQHPCFGNMRIDYLPTVDEVNLDASWNADAYLVARPRFSYYRRDNGVDIGNGVLFIGAIQADAIPTNRYMVDSMIIFVQPICPRIKRRVKMGFDFYHPEAGDAGEYPLHHGVNIF